MKLCRTCLQEKPREDFPSTGWHTKADGTKTRLTKADCKVCHNRKTVESYHQRFLELGVVFKCKRCGYDKCEACIDFHHTDPTQKDFNIAARVTISEKRLKKELEKCIVLCRNCHGELHAGLWDIKEVLNGL